MEYVQRAFFAISCELPTVFLREQRAAGLTSGPTTESTGIACCTVHNGFQARVYARKIAARPGAKAFDVLRIPYGDANG